MQDLMVAGWDCLSTMDVSRRLKDKSVLIFRRAQPFHNARYTSVTLTDVNQLRLVDFSDHVRQALRQALHKGYRPGVMIEKDEDASCTKMYLGGDPWDSATGCTLHVWAALMCLLEEASKLGWYLKASADVSAKYMNPENGPSYPLDVDSWFFCHFDTFT